jgi:hypothetical protein
MENKTPNPEKAMSAEFDSVDLINKLVIETIDHKKKANVERNVGHLKLMLKKEFFTTALTTEQRADIDACIVAGEAYTA